MEYIVEITETLQKQIKVNADNKESARSIAKYFYKTNQEVLMAEDLKEVTIEVVEE